MSHNHHTFAANIQSEIIEPFHLVAQNFRSANKEISNETWEVFNYFNDNKKKYKNFESF